MGITNYQLSVPFVNVDHVDCEIDYVNVLRRFIESKKMKVPRYNTTNGFRATLRFHDEVYHSTKFRDKKKQAEKDVAELALKEYIKRKSGKKNFTITKEIEYEIRKPSSLSVLNNCYTKEEIENESNLCGLIENSTKEVMDCYINKRIFDCKTIDTGDQKNNIRECDTTLSESNRFTGVPDLCDSSITKHEEDKRDLILNSKKRNSEIIIDTEQAEHQLCYGGMGQCLDKGLCSPNPINEETSQVVLSNSKDQVSEGEDQQIGKKDSLKDNGKEDTILERQETQEYDEIPDFRTSNRISSESSYESVPKKCINCESFDKIPGFKSDEVPAKELEYITQKDCTVGHPESQEDRERRKKVITTKDTIANNCDQENTLKDPTDDFDEDDVFVEETYIIRDLKVNKENMKFETKEYNDNIDFKTKQCDNSIGFETKQFNNSTGFKTKRCNNSIGLKTEQCNNSIGFETKQYIHDVDFKAKQHNNTIQLENGNHDSGRIGTVEREILEWNDTDQSKDDTIKRVFGQGFDIVNENDSHCKEDELFLKRESNISPPRCREEKRDKTTFGFADIYRQLNNFSGNTHRSSQSTHEENYDDLMENDSSFNESEFHDEYFVNDDDVERTYEVPEVEEEWTDFLDGPELKDEEEWTDFIVDRNVESSFERRNFSNDTNTIPTQMPAFITPAKSLFLESVRNHTGTSNNVLKKEFHLPNLSNSTNSEFFDSCDKNSSDIIPAFPQVLKSKKKSGRKKKLTDFIEEDKTTFPILEERFEHPETKVKICPKDRLETYFRTENSKRMYSYCTRPLENGKFVSHLLVDGEKFQGNEGFDEENAENSAAETALKWMIE